MAAGNPSAAGGCTVCAGCRFDRESAGAGTIEPVTSPFGVGPRRDGLNIGRFNADEGCSAEFKFNDGGAVATGGGGVAGAKLGKGGGARSDAMISVSAGVVGDVGRLSARAADVSSTAVSAAISLFAASISEAVASLASRVLKIPKSKMLLANWIDPMIIATMLAARNNVLTRVCTLVRSDPCSPPFALRGSERCRPFGSWPAA